MQDYSDKLSPSMKWPKASINDSESNLNLLRPVQSSAVISFACHLVAQSEHIISVHCDCVDFDNAEFNSKDRLLAWGQCGSVSGHLTKPSLVLSGQHYIFHFMIMYMHFYDFLLWHLVMNSVCEENNPEFFSFFFYLCFSVHG